MLGRGAEHGCSCAALPGDWRVTGPLAMAELANQGELQREGKGLKKHLQKKRKTGKEQSVPG